MGTSRHRTLLLLGFTLSPGCAAPPELPAPEATRPWREELSARISDDLHAFVPEGDAFVASSPAQGLEGRFDQDGARLARGAEWIGVRTSAWGRAGAMVAVEPAPPVLGACQPGRARPDGACVPRLEYRDVGLTGWWAARPEGFQQGWTLEAPPTGDGPLVLDLAVEGATAELRDGEVWLQGEGEQRWIVSGLAAWDADGAPLSARFEPGPDGPRVVVEDEGARYPVEIDPVYSTATTTLSGETTNSYFGYSVSGAGDVNGDGYDDVIVGAYVYATYTGRAYLYMGSSSGVSDTAETTLSGSSRSDGFGRSVSGAGDVNGDGYDDVIVGAYGARTSDGEAYVYAGSSSGLSSTPETTLTGASAGFLGLSVSGAGDVNGDGYDDVIVGEHGVSSLTGKARVYHGSSSGVSTTATTVLSGLTTRSWFGWSVSDAGDVNGDGYDDVIVGAYNYDSGVGQAYVFSGSSSGVSSTASTTLSASSSAYFGWSVSGAGDVDSDGYDDVIVGSYGDASFVGAAYVYHGSSSGLSSAASTTLSGETTSNDFGRSVSGAGDIDGDGYDDVIVGADGYSTSTGRAYVFSGSSSGLSSAASTTLTGLAEGSKLGWSVSAAGDIDHDGYDDVIVGAYVISSYTGQAYVHHGCYDEDADDDGVSGAEDCDDADASVFPGAADVAADGVDSDCDGTEICILDADLDGYAGLEEVVSTDGDCADPGEAVAERAGEDCDDADGAVHPGAPELSGDEIDEDCDAAESCYADADQDGYRAADGGEVASLDADCLDPGEATATVAADDCDDADSTVHPGAEEIVDGQDNDCDGHDETWDADSDEPTEFDAPTVGMEPERADPDPGPADSGDDGEDAPVEPEGGADTQEPGDEGAKGGTGAGCAAGDADATAWSLLMAMALVRRRARGRG